MRCRFNLKFWVPTRARAEERFASWATQICGPVAPPLPGRRPRAAAQLARRRAAAQAARGSRYAAAAVFLLLTFLLPIAALLKRAVENPEVANALPRTSRRWRGSQRQSGPTLRGIAATSAHAPTAPTPARSRGA
jgi:putative spermidine/putrescine transport system permease protein